MIYKGETMGHKGVSQRKPKKSKLSSNDNVSSYAGKNPSVQTLVKDNSAALSKDGAKPSDGSNKKDRKGK